MKNTLLFASALSLGLASCVAAADDRSPVSADALNKITTVCQNCHGPNGDSVSGTFPRLNGQQADYIVAQLKNFRTHSRSDPHAVAYMWGMAAQLDDTLVADIAKYYASQKPTSAQTGGALAAQGKKIFMDGLPDRGIPACKACHGEHGEGNSEIPRIMGQHADYLRTQLFDYRTLLRENDIMHANTKDMTNSEIEAVISYLAND